MSCALCTPQGDVVFEDEHTSVVLHEDWAVLGHAMIVAKQHVENASDLEEAAWLHLARIWQRVERVLLALTKAERCVVMKLGIMTPHLHLHLYPVSASASRADVFAAIDMQTRVARDERFVTELRQHLTPVTP
ncbi:MAG TPA: HIT family protein [Thermoanaerobaculia bacterium]|nr:HIT family protein [Thermoanaerobaculia bacterium]